MKTPSFPDRAQRARVKAQCTAQALRRATRTIGRIYDQALAPSGVRETQFSLLIALSLFGEAPLLRLAEELSLDRTTLTRNLQPLERAGLVSSSPGKDQRVRLLRLTDSGRRALQRAYPLWEEAQSKVVKALGQRRWMELVDGLGTASRLREKGRG
jgi:DNA-binding MarR family transcriptional regulator